MTVWILIILVGILIITFSVIINKKQDMREAENKYKISFKETLDLTGLPLITFATKDKQKLNFLLDTGSNVSYINNDALIGIEYTKVDKGEDMQDTCFGIDGNTFSNEPVILDLYYKDLIFTDIFNAMDMSKSLNRLKQDTGATVHGILGCEFFSKYKYILDFKDFVAYSNDLKNAMNK